MSVSRAEQAAYKQEMMPEGLDCFEQIEYHCLFEIYKNFFEQRYTKEQAGLYKKVLLQEIAKLKETFQFGIKCFHSSSVLFNTLGHCIASYSIDRTLENADSIVTAYRNIDLPTAESEVK